MLQSGLVGPIQKGSFFPGAKLGELLDAAYDVLERVGLKVPNDAIRTRLRDKGYAERDGRLVVPRDRAAGYLDELKTDRRPLLDDIAAKASRTSLYGGLNGYVMNLDPGEGRRPFTMRSLVEQAQFVQKARRLYPGLLSCAPGYPSDVAPGMEGVAKYALSLRYCDGERLFEPTTVRAAEHLFDMAEVAGETVESLPVYPISPLSYAGDALEIVLAHAGRLKRCYVFSMPNVGVSGPMSALQTYALTFAEVLGSALFTRELTGLRVFLKPDIFPFDLRAMGFAHGSPEKFVYEATSADLLAQIMETPVDYHCTNVHVLASRPDAQAAAERASLVTAGAMLGATKFYCVGALCLDEVFDPRQLVIDMEILQHVERMLAFRPLAEESIPGEFAELVRDNVDRGFIDSDETLSGYADYHRPSSVFTRFNQAGLDARGWSTLERRVDEICGQIRSFEPVEFLSPQQQSDIDAILKRALGNT